MRIQDKTKISALIGYAVATLLCSNLASAQQQLRGYFPQAKSKEVQLIGYSGLKDTLLTTSRTDSQGKFTLQYPASYSGAALLQIRDVNNLIVLLHKENFEIQWEDMENLNTLKFKDSPENDAFAKGITLYQESEGKLAGLKYIRPMYEQASKKVAMPSEDSQKLEWLDREIAFQENVVPQFIASLPKDSYIRYYMKLRKLIQDMPVTANRYIERMPTHEQEFKTMDFAAPQLLRSGLYKELLEGYFQLMESHGDEVYEHANSSVDAMLASLDNHPQLKQEVAEHLFKFFEKRSLFKAAEHLAMAMLNSESCQLDGSRTALFEQYRKMAKGNVAPDITLIPNKSGRTSLYALPSAYKLVVFGASWCHACTTEIPKLKAVYNDWKTKYGVEIVFVSLDTDKAAYDAFVKDYPWISTTELKGWETQAARDYYVFATPTLFLLDKDNKIVLKPISPEQTTAWLEMRVPAK